MKAEVSVYKHTFQTALGELSIESTNMLPETVWNELLPYMQIKGEEVPTTYDSHSYIDTGKSAVVEIDFGF